MNAADLPRRTLMGPGPSDVEPRVLRALAAPTVGHLDPAFLALLDDLREKLRRVFGTDNTVTLPMSATGSAGMEACFVNLVEPGDAVLIGVNGVFGARMAEVAKRAGARVHTVAAPWGQALDLDALRRAARSERFKVLAVVHAETSTGVLQELGPLRAIADEADALLIVDTVTSLGGVPVNLDVHGVDATYSGTQKCLSCPPGLSPVSFSARAMDVVRQRKTAVQSWYLDLNLLGQYWGKERAYHHTAPINMLYGLHEALSLVLEEGLEVRFKRHALYARALSAGLQAMGLALPVAEADRLPPLTLVSVPAGIDEAQVRRHLLLEHDLEIGAGLGAFAGKAWRIGLMGSGCTRANLRLCLSALTNALKLQGYVSFEDGLAAAEQIINAEHAGA